MVKENTYEKKGLHNIRIITGVVHNFPKAVGA